MFNRKQRDSYLDQAIDEALRMLDSNASDYLEKVEGIERLYKLKDNTKRYPSPDTLATVFGNLAGIWMIIHYERFNVITSKAMTLASKLR